MDDRLLIGGHYELSERLGQGGMGTVYRGKDIRTKQPVAVKMLSPDLIRASADIIERFNREAEALRALDHPHIVTVLDTVTEDDPSTGTAKQYIIMEYAGGGSLREKLNQVGQLDLNNALEISLDLADALTRAHRLRILHRDIKPANVLLADDGKPLLSDFGIAHFGDSFLDESPRLTQTGAILGTIDYLSPEALRSEELDGRADIWSFGVMMFEMLAGMRPFSGPNISTTLTAILTKPTPDLESLRLNLPYALIDLISRMLAKDREERIPSVRLVGAELEAILEDSIAQPDASSGFSQRLSPIASRFATQTSSPSGLPPHNLPVQATPFVGREEELIELSRLFAEPGTRLITILGPGGMGKSRLALEAATTQLPNFEHGVYFVPLAPESSEDNITPTIAESIGLQFNEGGEPEEQLLVYLSRQHMLLVIDNFEHMLEEAELISKILHAAPQVKVLVTSREKLSLQEEIRFRLEGLNIPNLPVEGHRRALEHILEYSAIKLFWQSAQRVRPGFELEESDLQLIVDICHRVQGVPLGILLAAAWVEQFSLVEIADEIRRSFDFLETDLRLVPDRHQSIRSLFVSTWRQLSESERQIFRRLAVFSGGFQREAAQAVAGASLRGLISLVNKSLLRRDPKSGRYEIHALLRQYAHERLAAAEENTRTQSAHSSYYTTFMEKRMARMLGPDQVSALNEIVADFRNVRRAWQWAVARRDYSAIERAAESLFVFCDMRSREYEGEELFRLARKELPPGPGEEPNPVWGRLLLPWYDLLLQSKGRPIDTSNIQMQAETELALAQKSNDVVWTAQSLIMMGHFTEPQLAINMYERALVLCPRLDDSFWVRIRIGFSFRELGDKQAELKAFQQSYERGCENGERERMGWSLFNLGQTESAMGNYAKAEDYWMEADRHFRPVGTTLGIIWTTIERGLLALIMGKLAETRSLAHEILDFSDKDERRFRFTRYAFILIGYLALIERQYQESLAFFERALSPILPSTSAYLGLVYTALGQGDLARSRRKLNALLRDAPPYLNPAMAYLVLPAAALIMAQHGDRLKAVELLALSFEHPHSAGALLKQWPMVVELREGLFEEVGRQAFADSWERGRKGDLQQVLKILPDQLSSL
jgi:serine/threonine protein kinase/tetratricopeptide (TPR) repeat protein